MSAPRLSHQECWELLPWHATGTLEPEEAARVDEHLAACAICREELRACRELAASLPGAAADPDPEPGLARLIARIDADADPAAAGRRRRNRPPERRGRLRERWRALLAATPRPVRAALEAQAAALGALALGTFALAFALAAGAEGGGARGIDAPEAAPAGATRFHTLSNPSVEDPAAPGAVRLRLVFAAGATEATVRALLLDAGARVVDGPTRFGVYTIEVAGAGIEPERLLARFADHPAVVFAEPALAAAAPPSAGAPAP